MQNYDCFSNLCIDYYYGTCTHCGKSWKGYDQILPYSKFYFLLEGECEIKTDNAVYLGKPGRMFFIPAHTRHSFYHISENFVVKHWIHFDIRTINEDMNELLSLPLYIDVPENRREGVSAQFERVFSQSKANTVVSNLLLKASLLELFATYVELSGIISPFFNIKENGTRDKAVTLNGLVRYINANLDKKLALEELAGMMHMHPNYFIRMFKKNIGVSPLKYINKMRFEKAVGLFANEDLTISDIMATVGFDDYSTFSNFFKSYSGYSPKTYRKMFIYRTSPHNGRKVPVESK